MAINLNTQAVIQSARSAYTPAEGEFGLAGYIEAVGAISQGLTLRKKAADELKSSVKKLSIPTDMAAVTGMVGTIQNNVIDGNTSLEDGTNQVKSIAFDVKNVIPKINARLATIEENGLSGSVSPIDENYILGLRLGELDNPVKIKDGITGEEMEISTFYQQGTDGNLLVLDTDGVTYVRPNVLLAKLENMGTIEDRKPVNDILTKFIGSTFDSGENSKFPASKDATLTAIETAMENKNVKYSFLLDNPKGFKVTDQNGVLKTEKWSEHYIESGLKGLKIKVNGVEVDAKEYYDAELKKYTSKEQKDKAQAIILNQLMEGDTNLDEDIDNFLAKIVKHKEPLEKTFNPIVSNPTSSTNFKIKGKLTASQAQDLSVIQDIESVIEKARVNENKQLTSFTAMGGQVELVQAEDDPNFYYFRKNMYGAEGPEKRYSVDFKLKGTSPASFQKVMAQVMIEAESGVTFGTKVYNHYMEHLNTLIQ
tara:strand:+ start:14029 stop:15468 length:1440 start_codon:yes stop_codon:yes gene_type:complete